MTREQTIEAVVVAARRPLMEIAKRRDSKYTDGKFHSPFGVPFGVKSTGEFSEWYYLPMAKDGTTYGPRCKSEEELRAHMLGIQSAQDAEFRSVLQAMSPAEVESQAVYWLKVAA